MALTKEFEKVYEREMLKGSYSVRSKDCLTGRKLEDQTDFERETKTENSLESSSAHWKGYSRENPLENCSGN